MGLVGLTREHCAGSALTMNLKLIVSIGSVIAGAFFIATGVDKLFHYSEFIGALRGYKFVPSGIAQYISVPLILAEVWTGVGLFVPTLRRIASLVGVFLILNFTAAILGNYFLSPGSSCGCWFTFYSGSVTVGHMVQNLCLIGLLIFLYVYSSVQHTVSSQEKEAVT